MDLFWDSVDSEHLLQPENYNWADWVINQQHQLQAPTQTPEKEENQV